MDKATALQSLVDAGEFVRPLPGSTAALVGITTAISFVEGLSEEEQIMPPAPPVITTARKVTSSSSQIANINATKPGPYRDIWVSNALAAFKFTAPRDLPLLIEDIKIEACREAVYPSGGTPGINNVTLRRIAALVGKRGVYIRYGSHHWLVEDCHFKARGVNTETGVIPMGVQLKDTAHDLTFRRVICEGFQTDLSARTGSSYWNADGFVSERGNYNLLFEDCVARNCTDGGFDLKSDTTRLHRCLAEGCARNFRLWENMNLGHITSINPIKRGGAGGVRHIGIYGGTSEIHIERLVVRSDNLAPIFVSESKVPVTIIVDSHDFQVPEGTPVTAGGTINLVLH